MQLAEEIEEIHTKETCKASVNAIKDTLYVLSGKWKLPLIMALRSGPKRFKDIQTDLETITPRILSKELKELELNGFVQRHVFSTTPVTVTYQLTKYSGSLDAIIKSLKEWGVEHRKYIVTLRKTAGR